VLNIIYYKQLFKAMVGFVVEGFVLPRIDFHVREIESHTGDYEGFLKQSIETIIHRPYGRQ
jgi:hypothetical protein